MQPYQSSIATDAMDLRAQWYALSDSQEMALRLHSSTTLGENMEGDLVFSARGASHAARIKVIADQLWLAPLTGSVVVDGTNIADTVQLHQYSKVGIGSLQLHIGRAVSDFAPDMTVTQTMTAVDDTVCETVDETVTDTSIPILEDRVEEIILQEVGFRKPVDEPSRLGALPTDNKRSAFRRWSWKHLRRKRTALSSLAVLAGLATITFWLAPKLGTNTGADAEASLVTRTEIEPIVAYHRIRARQADSNLPPNPTSNVRDKSDDQLQALVSLTEHGEVSTANNDRILTLATALQSSAHIDAMAKQLDVWQSRLREIADTKKGLQMTTAVTAIEQNVGNVRALHTSEQQQASSNTLSQIAELNERANLQLRAGHIYEPGSDGLVSTAQKILALDPDSKQGKLWMRKAVDTIVARARRAATAGSPYEARNLIEDALALDPNHSGAKLLWSARLVGVR